MIWTIPKPPLRWCEKALAVGGIIAGGACRDLILSLPIADIDIFIPGFKIGTSEDEELFAEYKTGFRVKDVIEGDLKFQIIQHRFDGFDGEVDISEILSHFDVGICRIAFDPKKSEWLLTEEFIRDALNKTLTVYLDNYRHSEHMEKLKLKFPNHEIKDETSDFDIFDL